MGHSRSTKKNYEIAKLRERSKFFFLKSQGNKRNINKVTLAEEVVAMDGDKDEEAVEVMAENTNLEMKRSLKTSQR